jgi:hypothetical protein
MSREFYDLCYDQYKLELEQAESLYQRAGVMLVALPALGAVAVTIGRIDILAKCFTRVDICLYYLGTATGLVTLAVSTIFLFLCVYPRQYKSVAGMDTWLGWREQYQDYLKKLQSGEKSQEAPPMDAAMIENMCPRLAEAQATNAGINEKRRKYFQRSVFWAALCLAAIGLQSVFALLLRVQGI